MENAAKALIIAAGVLLGIMMISLIIYGYNNVTNYYTAKEEAKASEQLDTFNKQYTPYNRDDVRGSDLLSLVNKILDYNKQNAEDEETIEISIYIKDDTSGEGKTKNFYYSYSGSSSQTLIKLHKSSKNAYDAEDIADIVSKANKIEATYNKYATGMATTLANNLSTIMGNNSAKSKNELLVELKIMGSDDTKSPDYYVDNAEILKYYQYIQFKRAHFNCTNLTYKNGRVKSFTFEFNGRFE